MATRILIADDDPIHRRNLEAIVMRMGYRTILADGGASALGFVSQRKDIVLMLLDLSMPDMDGLTVLRRMREAGNNVPVIVLVQNDDLQPVLQAMKMGAVDFVTKPVAFERVQVSVSNVLKIDALTQEIRRARSSLKAHLTLSDMAIKSPEMERVSILARRASALDAPLLIEGEPGSGKETLARAICSGGARWRGPFVTVDCRTLTVDNADEVFFGVSTARRDRREDDVIRSLGKLVEADGGTLFLDEVGALPRHTQIKLLPPCSPASLRPAAEASARCPTPASWHRTAALWPILSIWGASMQGFTICSAPLPLLCRRCATVWKIFRSCCISS